MEKDLLKIIADNPALLDALKKLLEDEFLFEGISMRMSNEDLGGAVRACLVGREGIDRAFIKISKYKSVPDKPEIRNPAR